MSGFKAVVIWVPAPRRALANAVVMSAGALGLLVATVPMEYSVQAFGWRAVFGGLTAITAVYRDDCPFLSCPNVLHPPSAAPIR